MSKPKSSAQLQWGTPRWRAAVAREKKEKIIKIQSGSIAGPVALGYHFSADIKMPHGDGREIKDGAIFFARYNGKNILPHEVSLCNAGLHASPTPYDALQYVSWDIAQILSYVLVRGVVGKDETKFAGYMREHLKVIRLTMDERLALAYMMGGGGKHYGSIVEKEKTIRLVVNSHCRRWLGEPEVYPVQ